MKVDTMRKIDKWAGVPLCTLISIFSIPLDFLRGKNKQPNTQNTLFIELSEMGSAIIADPAMRKLQKSSRANLFFVIFKDNVKSLSILNTVLVENIFTMRHKNILHLTIDIFQFIIWCRRKKITCTIDLELFSRFTSLLSFFSFAKDRVGFSSHHDEGMFRGWLINCPVRYNPHVHMGVNFISLTNYALGYYTNPYPTSLVPAEELELSKAIVTTEAKDTVLQKIHTLYPNYTNERIVLFNVNASDLLPQRRWLPANFALVAKQLLEQFSDILIVFTGAPAERAYVQNVIDMASGERCINSSGVFSFSELVPLYSISTFMITNDSGPAHFASVTNLKVFVLFGPETPKLYLPLGGNAEPFYLGFACSPCVSAANHRKTSCEERPCITGISTIQVQTRLAQFLTIGI